MQMLMWILHSSGWPNEFWWRKGLSVRIPILPLAFTARIPSKKSSKDLYLYHLYCQNFVGKNCGCQSFLYGWTDHWHCHIPASPPPWFTLKCASSKVTKHKPFNVSCISQYLPGGGGGQASPENSDVEPNFGCCQNPLPPHSFHYQNPLLLSTLKGHIYYPFYWIRQNNPAKTCTSPLCELWEPCLNSVWATSEAEEGLPKVTSSYSLVSSTILAADVQIH